MVEFHNPSPKIKVREKVMIYILDSTLSRVLTFLQPQHPDAGRQIPAGTVEKGEHAHAAAVRELTEETGRLTATPLRAFATSIFNAKQFKPEIHHRTWFYLVDDMGDFPVAGWRHVEKRPRLDDIVADYEWIDVGAASSLIAGHGHLLAVARDLARAERNACDVC